jgi:hypothetical protein
MRGSRVLWFLVALPLLALVLLLGGCEKAGSITEHVGTRAETQYETSFLGPSDLVVKIDNVSHTMPFSFWCDEGAFHDVYFPSPQWLSPDTRYMFQSWTHPDFLGNPATILCDSPKSTSVVVSTQYNITFDTRPATALEIVIDAVPYLAPQNFWWNEGEVHHIDVTDPQIIDLRSRYIWKSWSDGGERSHNVTISKPEDYIVTFAVEYMVDILTNPMGLMVEVDGIVYISPMSLWWEEGSTHYIYAQDYPPNYWWLNWSDGGDQGHTITITAPAYYCATYISGHEVIVTTDPLVPLVEVDGVMHEPPASVRCDDGTILMIGAPSPQVTPNSTLFFSHWSDGGSQYHNITANTSLTITAYYTGTVQVTVDTLPTFQEILVDGTPYFTPKLFHWDIGSVHSVEAHEQIAVGQKASLRFSHWSDGGARFHDIVVEGSGAFVAHYDRYYLIAIDTVPRGLNVSVDGQNATSLSSFWWREGSVHSIQALSPQERNRTKFMFIMWDDGNHPPHRILTVREPRTLTALFKPIRALSAIIPPDPVEAGYVGIGDHWLEGPVPGSIKIVAKERELSTHPHMPR